VTIVIFHFKVFIATVITAHDKFSNALVFGRIKGWRWGDVFRSSSGSRQEDLELVEFDESDSAEFSDVFDRDRNRSVGLRDPLVLPVAV
jgi:adenine-specific DNA methylase